MSYTISRGGGIPEAEVTSNLQYCGFVPCSYLCNFYLTGIEVSQFFWVTKTTGFWWSYDLAGWRLVEDVHAPDSLWDSRMYAI